MTCECKCNCDCKCDFPCTCNCKECNPNPTCKMSCMKRFDVALATRNFEIDLFWKRSNYFLVLNTAIAVGFVSFIKKDLYQVYQDLSMVKDMESHIHALVLCFIGVAVCLAWGKVNLGSKFWQSYWEEILTQVSWHMGVCYFAQSKNNKTIVQNNLEYNKSPNFLGKYYNKLVSGKPSVSKWMTHLSFFFLGIWLCIGGFISYKIEATLFMPIWFLFWLVIGAISRLFWVMTCLIIIITPIGFFIYYIPEILNFLKTFINI